MSTPRCDYVERGVESDCCSAPVLMGDICSECREQCCPRPEDEDEEAPE